MVGIEEGALGGFEDACSDGIEDGSSPCDKLGADEAAEVAIGDCSPYAVKGSNTEGPEDVVADGC